MAPWLGGGCNITVVLGGVGRGGVGVAEGLTMLRGALMGLNSLALGLSVDFFT